MGRIFFYFEKQTGDLKWMYFDNEDIIMRVNGGMQLVNFVDEDFEIYCTAAHKKENPFTGQ